MSLWGCDYPLLALAACHWRRMVYSRLVLFSSLLCAQAWWCLRAFCLVAISQSDLLAQVNSLRLPSGHSGPVLTLSNAARASLPSRRLLVANAGVCAASLLGELLLGSYLWVLIIYLFFLPVMLPSVLPRLTTDWAVRLFPGVWKLLSF